MTYYQGDYYRGDYYRGDYYRGDPGLFSFLGKALGGLAKGALNLATGGTLGGGQQIPTFQATAPPPPGFDHFVPSGPGTLRPYGAAPQMPMLPPGQAGMRRMHWNKSTYITRGGGTSKWPQQLLVHVKGTNPVPSRRMNVGNARALRRALHRVSGFAHLARRVMSFVRPGHGRGKFKFHKKRKALHA